MHVHNNTEPENCPGPDPLREIKDLDQWVLYRYTGKVSRTGLRERDPHVAEPPFYLASPTDPRTWRSYEQAQRALIESDGRFDGLWWATTEDDGYVGADLDHCRNQETGEWSEAAMAYVRRINSYTEISPSGNGLRIIMKGDVPRNREGNKKNGEILALWKQRKFLSITGNALPGFDMEPQERTEILTDIVNELEGHSGDDTGGNGRVLRVVQPGELRSNEVVLKAALGRVRRPAVKALFHGDISGFESHSEADHNWLIPVCAETDDDNQVDELYRACGLDHDEWFKPDGKYRQRSIASARAYVQQGRDLLQEGAHRTDLGNAYEYMTRYGDNVRYLEKSRQWYIWNGSYFQLAEKGEHERLMYDMLNSMVAEAAAQGTSEGEKDLKWALNSRSDARMRAITSRAKSLGDIPVAPSELDRNPYLFNTQNGVYDVQADAIRSATRDDLLTKAANVSFDPHATCPTFDGFLDTVFQGDTELIRFVWQMAGLLLSGVTAEKIVLFGTGGGDSGKTTLVLTLADLLGSDYAYKLPPDFLTTRQNDKSEYEFAKIFGMRLIYCTESEAGRHLANARVKEISGYEKVRGRHPAGQPFDYMVTYRLWLLANDLPKIRAGDQAMWNRVRILPFKVNLPQLLGDKLNPNFRSSLVREYPGILNRMIQGYQDQKSNGLILPESVHHANEEEEAKNDTVVGWMEDAVTIDPEAKERNDGLFASYQHWCRINNEQTMLGLKQFGQWMNQNGYPKERDPEMGSVRKGLHLNSRGLRVKSLDT